MPSEATDQPQGGGNFLTKKMGPLPVWGWVAVAVVAYLLYKHYTSSSSSATSTPVGTAGQYTPPNESITLPSGASYSGPAGEAPPSFTQPITSPTSSPGSTGSASPGGATGPGYGYTNVGGQQYVNLGTITGPGQEMAYNTGGSGAPIYYLPPGSSTPQLSPNIPNLPAGTEILTPAGYGNAVSSQASAGVYNPNVGGGWQAP